MEKIWSCGHFENVDILKNNKLRLTSQNKIGTLREISSTPKCVPSPLVKNMNRTLPSNQLMGHTDLHLKMAEK